MSKAIKQMQMDALKSTFKGVADLVFVNIVGLNAIAENQVRLGLRKKGIRLHQVKNSLARRVFGEMGMKVESPWTGSTTVLWGGQSIAELSKEVDDLAKKYAKFIKVKSAVTEGQEITFDVALKMPTKAQALGRVLSLILSPGGNIAAALLGSAGTVAGQIKQIGEKKEEEKKEGAPA